MLLLSHPTGNANVRALVEAAQRQQRLGLFCTALGFADSTLAGTAWPARWRRQLDRRRYDLPASRLVAWPLRESARLAAQRIGWHWPSRHEHGWASVDAVYRSLDRRVAAQLARWQSERGLSVAYAYEDGALATLRAARELGLRAAYELPIAYWQTARTLLDEEARRLPAWAPTLAGTHDSAQKLERKAAELQAADVVICPSRFVLDSIPAPLRRSRTCIVAEFGSPTPPSTAPREAPLGRRLRFLFAGAMSQRKGLADLFAACSALGRDDVELVVMGSPLMPLEFYRRQACFTHEAPRPHAEVLALMDRCDVLVLPSLVEGRALVQQEALSRGLPIIVTRNAGGEDLVEEGITGFLVPPRAPDVLAERMAWFADHRQDLPGMAEQARRKAASLTWAAYAGKVLAVLGLAGQALPAVGGR